MPETPPPVSPPGIWIIDRKISVAFLLSFLAYVVLTGIWVGSIQQRVVNLEGTDMRHEKGIDDVREIKGDMKALAKDVELLRKGMERHLEISEQGLRTKIRSKRTVQHEE